jgi:hypothetical protein
MGVLKGAIAATGIGALVLLISSLVSWFAKTDEGATKLDGILRAVGNTVDVLLNRLFNLKNTLTQLFTNPGEFFTGLVADIKEGIELGQELAETFDELDQKRRDMELIDQQQSNQIDQLLLQSKNVALSYEERLKILDQVDAIEKQNHENKLKYHEEYLAAVNKETEFQIKQGTISDEQLDKQNQARIEVLKVQNESITLQEKIENRRSQLLEKQQAERERAAQKEQQRLDKLAKEEDKRLKEQEQAMRNIEDLKIQLMDEGLQKQLAQIDNETNQKIAALVGSEEQITQQRVLLEEQRQQQIAAVREKWAKDEQEKKMAALELDFATEQNSVAERLLAGQITQTQFQEQTAQNAIGFQQQRLDAIRAAHGEESAEYQRAYAELLGLQQAQADQAVAIKQQEMKDQMAAMTGALGTFGNFFGTLAGMQQQGTLQWKAFATTAAILSTIQGAINAFTSTAAIPVVGSVLAPIAAAAALAAGYANVRKIQSQKVEAPVKKASRGTVLRGPSHAQGGIPIEAEGDEIILTKGVYRNARLRAIASDINAAAGGVRFETGGPVNPYTSDSKSAAPSASGDKSLGTAEILAVRDEIKALRGEVAAWPTKLKVINVVTETEEGIKTVNEIKESADV